MEHTNTCTSRTSIAGLVAGSCAISSNLLCIRTSSALSTFTSSAYLDNQGKWILIFSHFAEKQKGKKNHAKQGLSTFWGVDKNESIIHLQNQAALSLVHLFLLVYKEPPHKLQLSVSAFYTDWVKNPQLYYCNSPHLPST